MKPNCWLLLVICFTVVSGSTAAWAAPETGRLILQHEYIDESGGREFNDPSLFYSRDRFHLQAWFGELTDGVEVGGYDFDDRGSSYTAYYRFRDDFDHILHLETQQITGTPGYVLVIGARYIHVIPDEGAQNMGQFHIGADKYYGDYNFASLRAISDPRRSGRWTFVLSNRWATENSYLTAGLVPRTDGEVGYFVQGKKNSWRLGVGHYSRFDFTQRNRTIYNIGYEWALD